MGQWHYLFLNNLAKPLGHVCNCSGIFDVIYLFSLDIFMSSEPFHLCYVLFRLRFISIS